MKLFLLLVCKILLAFSSCPKNSASGVCTDSNFIWMVDGKVCANICPSQFVLSSPNCNLPNLPELFELKFWDIPNLSSFSIKSQSGTPSQWKNPSGNTYRDPSETHPLSTSDGGFYFETTSYIIGNQSFVPSLYFTANFWIRPVSSGTVMSAIMNSKKYIECILDDGVRFNIIAQNSNDNNESQLSVQYLSVLSEWHYLSFQINQISCNTVQLQIFINSVSKKSLTFFGYEANFLNGVYDWRIGNNGNSFKGFLYSAKVRNDLSLEYSAISSTISCPYLQYWDGSECNDCSSSCIIIWPLFLMSINCITTCESENCIACTSYSSSNMCTECIVGANPSGCDWLAETCDSIWKSKTCKSGKYLIDGVCLNACPYGFDNNCSPVTTPVITADFMGEFEGIYDNILVTGTDASSYYFWNSPEPIADPIPAKGRGLWFREYTYLEAKIDLSYEFTFELWAYINYGSIIQFIQIEKLIDGDKKIEKIDLGENIHIIMENYNGANLRYNDQWSSYPTLTWFNLYFSMKFDKNTAVSTFMWSENQSLDNSFNAENYIFRPSAGGSLFLGSSDFNGFISYFRLWQAYISNMDIPRKDFGIDFLTCDGNSYFDGNNCQSCYGSMPCVREGDSLNICDSELCLECSSFLPDSCTLCVENRSGGSCKCASGLYQPSGQTNCTLCDSGCSDCTGPSHCTSCISGHYYLSVGNICLSDCPLGYTKASSECLLANQLIFNLNLNSLSGVVYDSANLIPVLTGSSEQFYPDYEEDDPIGAYLRGFYFNGISSVMRLPEYKTYISPKLKIGPVFTISIWLNIENENSAVISKNNVTNSYSTIYAVYSINSKPAIQLLIKNSLMLYICQVSLIAFKWNHLVFQVNIDNSGNTVATCYINTSPDSSFTLAFGYFQDNNSNTVSLIGAQQASQDIGNFFKGFLYEIKIYNVVYSVTLLSQTSCSENCGVCPIDGSCIPNCKINEFWKGPEYNKCSNCNSNCKNGCKDSQTSCSACYSPLCDTCIDYSSTGCIACKSKASLENNSCICDIDYVFDNSNSCISIPAGGYRGPDGLFYPCPNLCSACESSLICNSCVNHASLNNNLCNCNNGYNGTTTCTYVPFSVNLIVFSNDSLSLNFSDPLQNVLAINNIAISIENDPKFTWNLEQVNNTYYYVPMSIKDWIPQDGVVNVTFLVLSEVKSIWNGMLNSSTVTSKLNKYDPNPYILVVSGIASNIATIVQSTVIGSIILSILNQNPSSLWGLLNCLQILNYLSLSRIPFSNKMIQFFSSLNSYNFFPNFFEYLIEEKEGNKAYKEARNFGYSTDLVLLNQGDDFSIIITSIVVLPFVIYFANCSYRFVGKKFKSIFQAYKYSFYIRFWIQCYLELTAAASVGLVEIRSNNAVQIANIFICFLLYLLSITTPPAFFWFSYKNRTKIQKKKKAFNLLFSTLFYEFRTEKGFRYTLYYFVYFLRRFIYISNLVFLNDYTKTQVALNIICSLMSIFYLLVYRPFKDRILQISHLFSEMFIGFIMCETSFYLFDLSSDVISGVENSIIFISLIIIGTQFCASVSIFSRNYYEIFRQKLTDHGNKKNRIYPINKSLDKL